MLSYFRRIERKLDALIESQIEVLDLLGDLAQAKTDDAKLANLTKKVEKKTRDLKAAVDAAKG